jgi:hypothetical protein
MSYLAWVGRSKVLWTGAATVFAIIVTLFFVPGTETLRDHFTVTLALDKTTSLPLPSYYSPSSRIWHFNVSLLLTEDHEDGQPGHLKPRVVHFSNWDDKNAFYVEWLQYQLLFGLWATVTVKHMASSSIDAEGSSVSQTRAFTPPATTHSHVISGKEILAMLSNLRFLRRDQRELWTNVDLRLPAGVDLSLPDHALLLNRPNYFRVLLTVEPLGGGDGPPQFLKDMITQPNIESISMIVRMQADFDGLAAENPDVVDAKEWTKAVFARLKREMGDPD